MRLIDADALREQLTTDRTFTGPISVSGIVASDLAIIDAAPTVCCAECEYGPPPADAVGARTACLHCFCGDNFERRQT